MPSAQELSRHISADSTYYEAWIDSVCRENISWMQTLGKQFKHMYSRCRKSSPWVYMLPWFYYAHHENLSWVFHTWVSRQSVEVVFFIWTHGICGTSVHTCSNHTAAPPALFPSLWNKMLNNDTSLVCSTFLEMWTAVLEYQHGVNTEHHSVCNVKSHWNFF